MTRPAATSGGWGASRFSADPVIDKHLGEAIRRIVKDASNRYGNRLISILLTGSAGRGEAVGILEDSSHSFTSDLDFVLVFSIRGFVEFRKDVHGLSRQLSAVAGMSLTDVQLNPTFEMLLRLTPPTISYLDLTSFGRLVYGRSPRLKHITPAMVSPIDALELIFNRIAEFLEKSAQPAESRKLLYLWAKTTSDAIGGWLALRGEYSPSYRRRLERVTMLRATVASLIGAESFELVSALLRLRIEFDAERAEEFSAEWPNVNARFVASIVGRVCQVSLHTLGVDLAEMPSSYWPLYRERLALGVWAPYLAPTMRAAFPFIARTGVHPKAVLNYCALLLLNHILDGKATHLEECTKLLQLLGTPAEPHYDELAARMGSLFNSFNKLAMKPHIPWVFGL